MKIKLLLLLMISAPCCWAQQVKVKWGEEYSKDKNEYIPDVVYFDGSYLYATTSSLKESFTAFGSDKVTPSLLKMDQNLKVVKRRDFVSGQKEEKMLYVGTYFLGGNFIMVTKAKTKQPKGIAYYAQVINRDLEPEGKNTLLWKLTDDKIEDAENVFDFSNDSTKFMIVSNPKQKDSENRKATYKVFDKSLNTLTEKAIEFPNTVEQMEIWNANVEDNGDVLFFSKIYKDKIKESVKNAAGDKIAGYDVVIKKYAVDGIEKSFVIDMGGRFLNSARWERDGKGNMVFIVLYEKERDKGINGFVTASIDVKTGNINYMSDFAIPSVLASRIDEIQDDKPKCKDPGINENFKVTDIFIQPDGSLYALLEKNRSVFFRGNRVSYMHYESEGMVALKMDSVGKVLWSKYVPKKQFYNDLTMYIFHTAAVIKNKLYIFFNDELDNEQYDFEHATKAPEKFNALKEMNLVMVAFDEKGKMKKTIVGSTEKMGTNINIEMSKPLAKDRFLLTGYLFKKKEVKIGVATFE